MDAETAIGAINTGMGIFSSIRNLFGGGASSAREAAEIQYQNQLKLQREAQNWNERMYKNRYQWQTEDLEKAGINKLYGLGSAPSPTVSAGAAGMPDLVTDKNNKIKNFLTGVQLAQDFSAKRAAIRLENQKTETEKFNTQLKALEKVSAELDNLYKKKELNAYDKRLKLELEETKSRITKNLAETGKANAEAGTARANTEKIKAEKKGIDRTNKWHEEHPVLSGLAVGGNETRNIVKSIDDVLDDISDYVPWKSKAKGATKAGGRAGNARYVR